MKTVRMIEEAEKEFVDALVVHDLKWKRKGRDLYKELIDTMRDVGRDPLRFPVIDTRHQRATLPHCPFDVIFRNRPDRIWIIAIAHHKRRRGYWRRRSLPNEN